MTFDVELWFNGRASLAGQEWSGTVSAESVNEALEKAATAAVREPRHGRSIVITGCLIKQRGAGRYRFRGRE